MNVAIVTACLLVNACVYRIDRTVVPTFAQVGRDAKYLKVHMRDGDVYVLDTWSLDPSGAELVGTGEHRGPDRGLRTEPAPYRIKLGEVAVYETDVKSRSPGNVPMTILTAASAALSLVVIILLVGLSQERT